MANNNRYYIIIFGLLFLIAIVTIVIIIIKKKTTTTTTTVNGTVNSSIIPTTTADGAAADIANIITQQTNIVNNQTTGYTSTVNTSPNAQYVTNDPASPSAISNLITTLGPSAAGLAIQEATIKLSNKAMQYIGQATLDSIIKVAPNPDELISATQSLGEQMAKESTSIADSFDPVGWGFAWVSAVNALWDFSDANKTSTMKPALYWKQLSDTAKAKFVTATGNTSTIKGPLTDLILNADSTAFATQLNNEILNNQLILYDTILNQISATDLAALTTDQVNSQILTQLGTAANQSLIMNMSLKSLCEKNGNGKYLGGNNCTYATQAQCDSSYTWPISPSDPTSKGMYAQWSNNQCLATESLSRSQCEAEGSSNLLQYDYNSQICMIKQAYCTQFGYQFEGSDPASYGLPNCYQSTGRQVLDAVVGTTLTQDVQNIFSNETNCGGNCSPTQYCYTVTGKGGVCVDQAAPGGSCPTTGTTVSPCLGQSVCKESSAGIAAAFFTALAAVAIPVVGSLGAALVAGGGRAVTGLGICPAGADGVNPSTGTGGSNPGQYLPLNTINADGSTTPTLGCSAVWNCPNGYYCQDALHPCQPQKSQGATCIAGQCKAGLWCSTNLTCQPLGNVGDYCNGIAASADCQSGLSCGANSKCYNPNDPCSCANTATWGDNCGDWDASGYTWCYVKDPVGCAAKGGTTLTKSTTNSSISWKKCPNGT